MKENAMKINNILQERGNNYGSFRTQGFLSQQLKTAMSFHMGYASLSASQKEALEMIQHKIARIINGNANYVDSWVDIAGYATLIVDELTGDEDADK